MIDGLVAHLPAIVIILPLAAAFAIPVIDVVSARLREPFIAIATVLTSSAMFLLASRVAVGPFAYAMGGWPAALGIVLVLDKLSAVFIVMIAVGFSTVAVYSKWSVEHGRSKYYMLLFLLTGAMAGMVLTGDLFNLFVFSEIVSIAAYSIVAHEKTRDSFEAGLKYLIFGTISGIFVLLGVSLTFAATGTLNMAMLSSLTPEIPHGTRRLILACFLVGFGLKAGIFPLHAWLPDAHSSAPAGASAVLSGVVVKTGVYTTLRLMFTVFAVAIPGAGPIFPVMAWLGTLSVITGHLLAMNQSDLKRLLAYSTVAQVGYIFIGLGAASPSGLAGAAYHAFNHTFMKAALFMAAGTIVSVTGCRRIDRLNGLFERMPVTTVSLALAAVAIVGIPPFNGFMSKWTIMLGALEAGQIIPVLVIPLGTALSAVYYFRILSRMFTPVPTSALQRSRVVRGVEAPWYVLACVGLLVAACVVFGGIPGVAALPRYLTTMSDEILRGDLYVRAVVGP
ncbi:MAG: complex I subunit 5 family protein [Bacillota bacterium]